MRHHAVKAKKLLSEVKSKVERRGLNKEQSDYDRWSQVVGTTCPLVKTEVIIGVCMMDSLRSKVVSIEIDGDL